MYLFDTDVITTIFKQKPATKLLKRLAAVEQRHQYIATTTVAEIVYGAWKSERPRYHLDHLENILLPAVNIMSLDCKAAYVCGALRARLEKAGMPLALADLEIAAIAIVNRFILVTGNERQSCPWKTGSPDVGGDDPRREGHEARLLARNRELMAGWGYL